MAMSNSNTSGRNRRAQFRTNILPFRSSPPSWGEASVMDMNSTQSSSPSHPGCISPMNPPLTIKEVSKTIDELKKENFDLKIRIFLMEENVKTICNQEQFEAFKLDLDVHVKTLQQEVTLREKLIQQMFDEATSTESNLNKARQRIVELEQQVASLKEELQSIKNKEETFSTPVQSDCDSTIFKTAFGVNSSQISATISHNIGPSTNEEIQRLKKEIDTLKKEFQVKNEELEAVKKKSRVKSVSIQALTTKLQQYVKAQDSEMGRLMKEGVEAATENDTEGIIFVVHKIKEYLSQLIPREQKATTSEKGILHTTYDVDERQPKTHSEDLLKVFSWPSVKPAESSKDTIKDMEALLQEKCDALESLENAYADLVKECSALKSSQTLDDNSDLISHLQTEIELKTNKIERLTAHCRELEQEMVNLKSARANSIKSAQDTKVSREVQHSSVQTHVNLASLNDITDFGQSNDIKKLKEEIFILLLRLEEKHTEVSTLKYEISDLQLQLQEAVKQKEKFSEQAFVLQRHVEKLAKFMEQLLRGETSENIESSSEMLSEVSKCLDATLRLSQTMSQNLSVWDLSKHFAFDDSSVSEKRVSFDEISLPSLSFSKSAKTASEHEGRAIHSEASVGNMVRTGRRRRWSFSSQLKPESDLGATDMDHLMVSVMSESGDMVESTPFATVLHSKGSFRNYLREELHGRWSFAVNNNTKEPQPKARPCWNLNDKNKTLNSLNALEYKADQEVTQVKPFHRAKQQNNSNLIRLSSDSDIWSEPDRDVSIQRIGIAIKGPTLSPAQKSRGREKLLSTSGSNVIDKDRPESRTRRRRSGSQTRTSVQLVDKRLSLVESQQSKIAALLQTFEHVASQMSQLTEGSLVEKTESIERISSEMNSLKSILNSAVKELQNLKETVKDTVSRSQEVGVIAEFKENMEKVLKAVQNDDHLKDISPAQAKDIAKEALLELDTFKQQLLSVASSLLSGESLDKLYPSQRSKEMLIANATNLELLIDSEKLRNSQLLKEISDLKKENNTLCQQLEKLQTALHGEQSKILAAEKQKEQMTELLTENSNYKSRFEEKERKVQELIAEREELSRKLARRISLEKTANFVYETKLSDVESLCDQLKGSLKETEAKLKAMEYKCLEYEKDIANISQEKLSIKNERDDLAKTVKDQAEKLSTSEHSLQEVHVLCDQLKQECDTVQSKLNALQSKCTQLESEISSLKKEKVDTLNKNKFLEEKLQTQVDKIADMNKKHLEYESEKLLLHHTIENLQTELKNLQKELNDKKKASETREHFVKHFESEKELLNHQILILQKELDEKVILINEQNETITNLQKANEFLESRNSVFQSINKSYQQENTELTEQLSQSDITAGAAMSNAVELLEKKVEELNVTNTNLTQELNDKISMIQEQNDMIINLQRDIQTLEERCVVSPDLHRSVEQVQSDLEEQNNAALLRSASLENQLRELNAQVLNLNKELQAKCTIIQEQEDVIADLENRISSLEQGYKKAKVARQSLELENQGLLNKTSQLQDTIKNLEEQIEMSNSEFKDAKLKAEVILSEKDAEIMDLKNENEELANTILEKEFYIQKLHSRFPDSSIEFAPVEHITASASSQESATPKRSVEFSAEGKSQSDHHVEGLPEKISQLQRELDAVHCLLKENEESVEGLKRELSQRDRNISQQRLQLVTCEQQIQNYHSQLKELSATKLTLQNVENENQILKRTVSELKGKSSSIDYEKEKKDDLLAQLTTLRQELGDKEKVLQTLKAAKKNMEHEQEQAMQKVQNLLHETKLLFKERTNEELDFDLPQDNLQWSEQLIHQFVMLRNIFDSMLKNSMNGQAQIRGLKTEKEILEKQISLFEKQLEDQTNLLASVKETNSELCTQIADLKKELRSDINSRSELHLNHQILISEKEKLNDKVSELENKLKELQEQYTVNDLTKKQALDSLQTMLSEKSILCEELQEKIYEFEKQLSSTCVLLSEKTELIQELDLNFKSLQDSVAEKTKFSEELNQKVKDLEEELSITNQTFSNDIEVLQNDIIKKTELCKQLELKLQVAEKELLTLPEKISFISELQNKIENLQTSVTEKTKLYEFLEGKLNAVAKENSGKSIVIEELRSEINALQAVIATKTELCKNLEGKVQSMEKKLLEKSTLITELQNNIQNLETLLTEKTTVTGQALTAKSQHSKDLEDQIEILRMNVTERAELCDQLQGKLQTAEKELIAAGQALTEKSKLNKDLENQVEVLHISLTEKTKLCEQLQYELQTVKKELFSTHDTFSEKLKANEELERQVASLQSTVMEKTELCKHLEEKIEAIENECLTLRGNSNHIELEDSNRDLQAHLTEKDKLLEQSEQKYNTMEKEYSSVRDAFSKSSIRIKELEHNIETLNAAVNGKTEICKRLDEKIQVLQKELSDASVSHSEKSEHINNLENQIKNLQVGIAGQTELYEQLEEKYQALEKELSTSAQLFEEKSERNKELESDISTLQARIDKKTELYEDLNEKFSAMQEKLSVAEGALVEKEKLIKNLESDALIMNENIKELEANKMEDDLKMKALDASLTQLGLQKEAKIINADQIEKLNEQISSLTRKLSRAENALKRKDSYCKIIEGTSEMLRAKVSELEDQNNSELGESGKRSDPQVPSSPLTHNKSCQVSSRSLSQHENTIQELRNHLRSKERVIDQLEIQNSGYRTNIAALENKLKDFRTVSRASKSISCHLLGSPSKKNSVGLQTTDFAHIRSSQSVEKESLLSVSKSTERRNLQKGVTFRELVSNLSCFLNMPPDSVAKYITQLAKSASTQEKIDDFKDLKSLTTEEHELEILKLKKEKQRLMEDLEESKRQKLVLENRVQHLLYTLEAIDTKDKKLYEAGIQITKQSSLLSNKDMDEIAYIKHLTFRKWKLQQNVLQLEEELCQFHPSSLERQLQFIRFIRNIYSDVQSLSFVKTRNDSITHNLPVSDVMKCIAKERHLSLRLDIEFLKNAKMLMKYFVLPIVKHVYTFNAVCTKQVDSLSENLSRKFDEKKWGSFEKMRGVVPPEEDLSYLDFDESDKEIRFEKEISDQSIQISSLQKENEDLRAELQSFKQMSYFTNVAAIELLNSNSAMKQHSLEKKLTLAEPGLSIIDALDKASMGSGDDILILSESESGASLSSGVDLKQPRGKHRQGNEAVFHRRHKDRDATNVKKLGVDFETMAEDIHRSHYSSPDLGIESDPNQDHFAMGQLDSLTEPKCTKSKRSADGAYTDDDKLSSNSLPRSMKLHAFLNLEDFELLKKEIEECIIVMKSIDSRVKDGLRHLRGDGTPKKSFECSTLKGILDCSNHAVVCLTRSQQLVTHFCVSPVPGPVSGLNREQLVQENQRLRAIIDDLKAQQMQQETDIAAALKRLKKHETYKGFLNKKMLKQLVQTKKVLRQVRTNLNDEEEDKAA